MKFQVKFQENLMANKKILVRKNCVFKVNKIEEIIHGCSLKQLFSKSLHNSRAKANNEDPFCEVTLGLVCFCTKQSLQSSKSFF